MPIFAVQRRLPGITMDRLAQAQQAAIEMSEKLSREGTTVRYIRSNFYPADSRCTCLFESPDAESVKQLNETAALPFHEIEEVLDLNP